MTTQPAGEHHTGTLNLTGEGNKPSAPISDETVEAVAQTVFLAKYGVKWDHVWFDKTKQELAGQDARGFARTAVEAAYPAIRQQVAEQIAAAIDAQRDPDGFDIAVNLEATITKLARIVREIGGVRS